MQPPLGLGNQHDGADRPTARRHRALGAVVLAGLVVLMVPGCARRPVRAGVATAPASAPVGQPAQPTQASNGGVTAAPAGGGPLTTERLAELCVDVSLLQLGNIDATRKPSFWVAPRRASLDCSLALRWAICNVDMNRGVLTSGKEDLIEFSNGRIWENMMTAVRIMTEGADEDPKSAASGAMYFEIVGPEKQTTDADTAPGSRTDLHASANRYEANWLAATDADDDALVIRQARLYAPLLAKPEFASGRDKLLKAAAQALQADQEETRKLRAALQLPDDLAKARQAYCQRLARAVAAAR